MVVDDRDTGIEHGLAHAVEAADKVEVLAIHEVAVIKKNVVLQHGCKPQEHEAAAEAGGIHHLVIPGVLEGIAPVQPLGPGASGQEAAEEQVCRCGEELAQVLQLPVGINHPRQHVAGVRMPVHEVHQGGKHLLPEPNVRVQYDMVGAAPLQSLLHGEVVGGSIAQVLVVDVADWQPAPILPLKDAPAVVGRVVDDVEGVHPASTQERLAHPLNLTAGRVVEDNTGCKHFDEPLYYW